MKKHNKGRIFFLACLLVVLSSFIVNPKWGQLKGALPNIIGDYIVEYDETKQDHGLLVDAINKSSLPTVDNPDLPYHMTLMPKRISGDSLAPPVIGKIADEQVIPGEYGFSPSWNNANAEDGGSQAIVTRSGGEPYVTRNSSESFTLGNMISNGQSVENSIIFTNMGTYRGKQVDVKMTVVSIAEVTMEKYPGQNLARGVMIGTGSQNADSDPDDINPDSAMSVSETGASTYTKSAKPGYVEINYTFYEHPSDYNPLVFLGSNIHLPGESEPIAIQGFLTFVDFDFNESIGISNDANINRIYTLKTQKGDEEWQPEWESIDLFAPISGEQKEKQQYYDYFAYRFPLAVGYDNRNNMNFNELTYSVEPANEENSGYLYINRFNHANTKATARGNWFSFTYGETKSFNINFNASYYDDYEVHGFSPKSSNAVFKTLLNDPLNQLPDKARYYEMVGSTYGSTVGFFPQTLGPIKFTSPIKKADQDTSDKQIDWTIRQDVAPRYVKNGEPQFIIEDEFPTVLRVNKQSISIEDAYGQEVTNNTFRLSGSDVRIWDIQVTRTDGKDKLIVSAHKEYLKLSDFYQNAYTISVSTTLDETQDYLTDEYLDKEKNQLKFANSATLKMVDVDFSASDYSSRPDYGQSVEATIGRMDLKGQVEIEKRGESLTGPLLAGATFEIRDSKGEKVDGGTTGSDGKWLSKELPGGTDYQLVETVVPNGYGKAPNLEGVRVNFETNRLVIIDPLIRPMGTLNLEKSVFNEEGREINEERITIGQLLTYQIKVANSSREPTTLLSEVVFNDKLASSLDLIPDSMTISGSAITSGAVDPNTIVWDETTHSTLTLSKPQALSGGNELIVTFKAKVNQSATGIVENTVIAKGIGQIEGQEEPQEIQAQASVLNYLSMTVHLRQVIQATNDGLVKPIGKQAGYFSLHSLNSQDEVLATINKRVVSVEDINQRGYTAIEFLPLAFSESIEIHAVLPEMHDYLGYLISEQPDQVLADLQVGVPKAPLSGNNHYLTIVLQPSVNYHHQTVPFYNWDYLLNDFSQGIELNR